jgi:hypothetical protein
MIKNKAYGFEFWVQLNEIEKIKQYIQDLGYYCISDPTSNNQIYQKNGNTINLKEGIKG